jgi:hypothetical protein
VLAPFVVDKKVILAWLVGCALVAFSILRIDVPLSNDGPAHLYAAYVANHLDDPALGYARFWTVQQPLTARGFLDVFRALELIVDWRAAYRITVALVAVLSSLSFAVLVHALAPKRWVLGLLGFPFAYQWPFFLGFFPNVLGVSAALFLLAHVVAHPRPSVRQAFGWSLALLVVALLHPMPAAAAGVALACITVFVAREARARAALVAVVVGLPACAIVLWSRDTYSDDAGLGWPTLVARVHALGPFFQSGPVWRWAVALALVVVGLALALWRGTAAERAVAGASLVLLVIGVVAPWTYRGFEFMAPRVFPVAEMLAVALVPVERARRVAGAVVATYGLASLGWALDVEARVASSCAYATSGLFAPLEVKPRVLMPVHVASCPGVDELAVQIPRFQPTFHLAQLYSVAFGGFSAMAHNGAKRSHALMPLPAAPPLVDDPRVAWLRVRSTKDPAERQRLMRELLEHTAPLGIVGMMTPDDVDLAVSLGFRAEWKDGGFLLGEYAGP